jgi:hypothetical protein
LYLRDGRLYTVSDEPSEPPREPPREERKDEEPATPSPRLRR